MESSHYGLIFFSKNATLESELIHRVYQTLHLEVIKGLSAKQLDTYLQESAFSGFIFEGLPKDQAQARILVEWSTRKSIPLYIVIVDQIHQTDKDIIDILNRGFKSKTFTLQASDLSKKVVRDFFIQLSRYVLQYPKLAFRFYEFKDLCEKLRIQFIIISGACAYIYGGKRSLKDIDVCVPSKFELEKLAHAVKGKVERLESNYARTYYLNLKEIDVNTQIEVLYDNKKRVVHFDYDELKKDAQKVNFLGEECFIMSPEMLILFKLCLGRLGVDDFLDYKDDYEDARGVLISQPINSSSLHKRARRLNVLDRVQRGEKILGLLKS